MTSKPNSLELQVFRSPLEKFPLSGVSPPSPNTPTICLSAPKSSPNTNGFSFPSKTNHGFLVDDELSLEYGPHGNQVHHWDIPGILDTASMSSMLSLPTAAVAGALALSPGTRSLQTVPRSQTQETALSCEGSPTMHSSLNGSNHSLTIPPLNSGMSLNKRHSFPSPDDHLTPSLLSPKYNLRNRQKSLDGLHSISTNFDISPIAPLSPMSPAWARKMSSLSSSNSVMSSDGSFSIDADDSFKTERFRQIFKAVATKANMVRQNKVHPEALEVPLSKKRKRLDSFAPSSCVEETVLEVSFFSKKITVPKWLKRLKYMRSIDPSGSIWLSWLLIVAMAYVYNAFTIFLRGVFGYDNSFIDESKSFWLWLVFDLLFDFIYLFDIFLRMRIQFIEGGLFVEDKSLTRKHYFSSRNFKLDVISLFPLDLFCKIWSSTRFMIFLRLPRLLKYHSYSEFVSRFESSSSFANAFRVGKMVSYLLYMIHLNTCCYYAISLYEGLSINDWVYNEANNSNPYIRCMYRATKTLITIGNLPTPETDLEIVFMNIDFAIGIFVFASIIGQMRDIVGATSATKEHFRQRMDNTMLLMKNWQIPEHVQKKVRMWYMYKWDNGELIDEADILSGVPLKMHTDIAIHVHMDTLTKVSLFQDCDKMLLRDLMLKLRPVLFLPGDFICRKGEVGKEMYIIKSGQVQVLGGGKVLATLHAGSVFGEISLLSLSGGNRRTADVYSPGYANIFVLDKKTLHETLVNYPEAQELLQKKANEILKKNEENGVGQKKKRRGKSLIVESILTADKVNTPRFFNAVLHVARDRKLAATVLKGGLSQDLSDNDDEDDDGKCDEVQNHTDSVQEKKKVNGAEPNVIVHQPPEGVVHSERSQSSNKEDEQCSVRCGVSSSPCNLQQTIVVKEANEPCSKMEECDNNKEIDENSTIYDHLKHSIQVKGEDQDESESVEISNAKASEKVNSEVIQNELLVNPENIGGEFEKNISTLTKKEVVSPSQKDQTSTQFECDSALTVVEGKTAEECEKNKCNVSKNEIVSPQDPVSTQFECDSALTQVEGKCDSALTQVEGILGSTQIKTDAESTLCDYGKMGTEIENEPYRGTISKSKQLRKTSTHIDIDDVIENFHEVETVTVQKSDDNSNTKTKEFIPVAAQHKKLRKTSTHIDIEGSIGIQELETIETSDRKEIRK